MQSRGGSVQYLVDKGSYRIRLVQVNRVGVGLTIIDQKGNEFIKIQRHLEKVIKEVVYKYIVGPGSSDTTNIIKDNGDDIIKQ